MKRQILDPVAGLRIGFNIAAFFLLLSSLSCSGVSHSVTSDMHMIQQEDPQGTKTTKVRRFTEDDEDEGSFSSRSDNEHYNKTHIY